jgi:arylsulfatase A-like enzyme
MVVIIADDLGLGDLGCYGQQRIRTPHIDRLAKEGMRFTTFYAGGASSAASGWCFMTGYDTARAGTSYRLPSSFITLAEMMWQAGYETGFIGNWQLTTGGEAAMPHLHGYDQWIGTLGTASGTNPHFPESIWSDGAAMRLPANAQGHEGQFIQDFYTQEAIAFLERHRSGVPFLLVLAYTLPHASTPIASLNGYAAEPWTASQKAHAAMVSRLDLDVGLIVDRIEQLGLDSRTLVMLTSDNSPPASPQCDFFRSTGALKGTQGSLYEGGLRVPLIARWPAGVPRGTATEYPAAIWDLLPTMAALSGAARRPSRLDGVSLAPVLRGGAGPSRGMLYWEDRSRGLAQAVRMDEWKVVRPAGKMQQEDVELYNLTADPGEQHNVARQHPDVVARFIKN